MCHVIIRRLSPSSITGQCRNAKRESSFIAFPLCGLIGHCTTLSCSPPSAPQVYHYSPFATLSETISPMLSMNCVAITAHIFALNIIHKCYLLYFDYIFVYIIILSIFIICYILVCYCFFIFGTNIACSIY